MRSSNLRVTNSPSLKYETLSCVTISYHYVNACMCINFFPLLLFYICCIRIVSELNSVKLESMNYVRCKNNKQDILFNLFNFKLARAPVLILNVILYIIKYN